MSDTDNRSTEPSRLTESVDRDTEPSRSPDSHGRTDWTYEAITHPGMNSSPNATPAGGLEDSLDLDPAEGAAHSHTAHVYVVYWPDIAVIKVGITERVRWQQWYSRGAVLIATHDPCCFRHARAIEKWLLAHMARVGTRAFADAEAARTALGGKVGGYTECYRLPRSELFGEQSFDPFDYERAYGLTLPPAVDSYLERVFARYPVRQWRPMRRQWIEASL